MEERSQESQTIAPKRSSPLARIVGGSESIDTWLNYLGMVFTVALMMNTVVQVVARWVFNSPIKGYIDLEEMLMALLVFLSAAYCQLKGGNIRFEMFMTDVLKEGRVYHAVEVIWLLISLLGFAMIAIFSLGAAIHAYAISDVTMTVHWPVWPAMFGAAIGSIFLCVRLLIQTIQHASWTVLGTKVAREKFME